MSDLLTTQELIERYGYKGKRLEDCLKDQGVRFQHGKNGIVTTIQAINAAMGISHLNTKEDENIL